MNNSINRFEKLMKETQKELIERLDEIKNIIRESREYDNTKSLID